MLQIAPQMRILVAIEAVDLRKGIDGLAELCREKLSADPFSGCLFAFRSRRATAIKLLQYDGQGFVLARKAYPGGVSSGGRAAADQRVCWKLIKHSYSSLPAIPTHKQHVAKSELKKTAQKFASRACVLNAFLSHRCRAGRISLPRAQHQPQ
jgi:hypothetical protein